MGPIFGPVELLVAQVLGLRAHLQMLRVDAETVVAQVTNNAPF
jgi:hypothetical protein|tara:strand:- start:1339 stop:1467 length:129 start_codon:yes stop_codon:yes gene_type:complete